MIQALTSQVLLAVEMERLSETVRKVAVAREQEKAAQERAAELARANEALKQSVDVLATETDLNQFIGHVLRLAAEQFDAPLAEYWQVTNPNIAKIVGWWGHNQIHGFGQQHDHPASESGVQVPSYMLEQRQFSDRRKHFVALFDPSVQPAEGEFVSDPASWYEALGVSWQLNLPLIVGETCFGVLNFWQPIDRPFAEHQIELGYALAQQVTLAIRLSQLAEEAQQAAIAREQEKATQEQAAELVKANEALRRSIAHLTSADHLQSFLVSALKEAIQASRADCGAVFVYQAATDTLQMTVLVLDGEPVDIATDPRAAIWRSPVPADLTSAWHMIQQRQIVWLDLNQPSPEAWQFAIPWHQAQGHKTIPMIPLTLGEQLLGFMGLAFTTDQPPNQSRFEQCRTFAHHAALALQMADLVQQTKQTALLEERNRMAREIHDTLAQSFTSISMQLEAATRFLTRKPEQAQSCLSFAQELARSGLAEARRSVWALQSEAEDYRHLVSTLQRLAAQRSTENSVQVEVAVVGTVYTLPADVGMNLLRIGQEALNNAIRHANAQIILLTLTYDSDQIQLQIQDDGQGFDPQLQRNSGGFGLMGMQQRSDRLGGAFAITSQLGKGTEVKVTVPIIQKEN
ncbi:GAF domain-containing protein [Leptolyngbya sp. FACHB-36]|nr:GAF domain-containing protein [Leptolyngbya sp. FACHB-36]